MRNFIFLFTIAILFTNCTKKLSNLQLSDDRSIEHIRIGMPLDEAIKVSNKDFFVEKAKVLGYDDEPTTFEYLVYSNKSKKESLFSFNGGHKKKTANEVFRIVIKSPKYITQEGIRVGMTMKELRTKGRLKSADFNYNDGLYIFSDKYDGGYWMDVNLEKYSSYNFDRPKIKTLPDDIKIKGIIMF